MKSDSRREGITKLVVHLAGFLHRLLIGKQLLQNIYILQSYQEHDTLQSKKKSASQPWKLGGDVLFCWKNVDICHISNINHAFGDDTSFITFLNDTDFTHRSYYT